MRTVLFDVDGVLLHSLFHADPARRRRWDLHLFEDMGVRPDDFTGFFGERFLDVLTGKTSLVNALGKFLPTVGYAGSPLTFLSYWLTHDTHLNLRLLDLLKRLRSSGPIGLCLATNQEHLRAFHLWAEVGLRHHFDEIYYAALIGAAKPSPAFFAQVDRLIGPRQEPPLFFDDSQTNVDAANQHGWEGVLFTEVADFSSHPWIAARLS